MNTELNAREINKSNVIAKYLGENSGNSRLLYFPSDNTVERIGNFNSIKDSANRINDRSKDYMMTWGNIYTDVDSNLRLTDLSISTKLSNGLTFSDHGLSGLCTQLDIPAAYIRKCLLAEELEEAKNTLNFWINKQKNQEKEILVRTTDNRIHGVLSNKYTVFDDREVLGITEDILGPYQNYVIKNYSISPEYMKIRVVSRSKVEIKGRPLSFGFDINNSRVGRSSLNINVIIFDHICSNGMIMGGGRGMFYSKRHIGVGTSEFMSEFIEMIDKAPDTINFIQNAVNSAANERLNNDSIQRYLDKFKAENLSKNIAGRVEQRLNEKYDNTLYGFVAAVTEVAQDYNIDTRERMERFGGNLIYQYGRKLA